MAEENKKDMKYATRPFKKEIDSIPQKHAKLIEQKAYETACSFINAFRAKNLASLVKERLLN
jgi:fructose-bisphosphate aldolase class II